MKFEKKIILRINNDILEMAYKAIKSRAVLKNKLRSETLSDFIRNIITEEWNKNRIELYNLNNKFKGELSEKTISSKQST